MIYRLFINYFRLKLLRVILNRISRRQIMKGKNLKTMSIVSYGLELLITELFNTKKRKKIILRPRPHSH